MSAKSTDLSSSTRHIYKVATYGRPSSGKTCIVATLAMARRPHPEGVGCVWICDDSTVPKPSGDPVGWDVDDPSVARYLGKERLRIAISELERGMVPVANAIEAPYRYLFDFTLPDGRVRRIEMMDYSGELVNPDITEGELAQRLRDQCEQADGILVLAEATTNDEQAARLERDLQSLKQAFMHVADRRRREKIDPIPLCLVVDKWDRVSRMETYSQKEAEVELSAFLGQKPAPPHKSLGDLLAGVAGSDGKTPFYKRFALSAFGKAMQVKVATASGERVQEVPATVNPLPSYGLEDPFVAVCDLADQLEYSRLRREVAAGKIWKAWQLPGRQMLRVAADTEKYARRFPRHTPAAGKAMSLAKRARGQFFRQAGAAAATLLLGLMLIVQLGYLRSDSNRLDRLASSMGREIDMNSPQAAVDLLPQWKEAADFMGEFQHPTWYRILSHMRYSSAAARERAEALNKRVAIAEKLRGQAADFRVRLDQLNKDLAEAKGKAVALDSVRNALDSLTIAPEWTALSNERASLDAKVNSESAKVANLSEEETFATNYRKALELANFAGISNLLVGKTPFAERQLALTEQFRREGLTKLKEVVVKACDSQDWDSASAFVNAYLKVDRKVIGDTLRENAGALGDWVVRKQKQGIYRAWYDTRNNQSVEAKALAEKARNISSLARHVEAYREYLSTLQTSKPWTIAVESVYFKNKKGVGQVDFEVEVSGAEKGSLLGISPQAQAPNANWGKITPALQVKPLAVQGDEVTLNFNVVWKNRTVGWKDDKLGTGMWKGKLSELVNGLDVPFSNPEFATAVHIYLLPGQLAVAPSIPSPDDSIMLPGLNPIP